MRTRINYYIINILLNVIFKIRNGWELHMSNYFTKNIKNMLCFVCIISLCLQTTIPVRAEEGKIWSDSSLNGLSFREIADDGWMVCAYNHKNNPADSLEIPHAYEVTASANQQKTVYKLRGVEDGVFGTKEDGSNDTFSKVIIQASEEITIGNTAFRGVQVEDSFKITGGKVNRIGERAFENAKISGDMVIDSLDECSIGNNAFQNVTITGKITLKDSIDSLGDYALSNLTCKGMVLPNTIRNMGDGVFCNTKMTGAIYPLSEFLESMGSRVFEGTGLKAIKLSEGNHLQSVAKDAFAGIEGTTIIMPSTVEGNNIESIINRYHININQKLIIQLPEDLPVDSDIYIYLKQNDFTYQIGEEGEIVVPTPTTAPVKTPEPVATPTAVPTKTPEPTATPIATPIETSEADSTIKPTETPISSPEVSSNATMKPIPTSAASEKPVVPKTTADPKTKIYQVKKLKYEITGKNQVSVAGAVRKGETSITIPNTVVIQGRLYQVTKIKACAFRDMKRLKTVKIGNYVKDIGTEAFARCQKLTRIQFGTGVVSLGKKTLYQDKELRIIIFKGKKLKKIGKKTFSGISPKKVSIKVKKSKMKAYLKLIRKAK